MALVIPNCTNISLTSGLALSTKNNFLSRCNIPRNNNKQLLPVQKYILPLSTSLRLFPQFRIGCSSLFKVRTFTACATGTDVAMEEADLSAADLSAADNEVSVTENRISEMVEESSAKSNTSAIQSKRPRSVRKSDMPPVKDEELVPGTTFTGKVRSIQPFGAFIDFGAFTDGLVHVSRLSDSFVKDVASVVTVGQEVTVRILEANMETGRISLSMRETKDENKAQQQKDAQVSRDNSRPARKTNQKFNQKKEEVRKRSKFVKGQDLAGTVKNIGRAGAFISLPEGEEGFLPTSEEIDEGFGNLMGGSSLEIGQEVNVRVLRITRGQVTLTMKKEEDAAELDSKLKQSGVLHTATNAFVLAFRSNKVISDFLDERRHKDEPDKYTEQDAWDTGGVSTIDEIPSENLHEKEELKAVPASSQIDDIENIEEAGASSTILNDDENHPSEDQMISLPSREDKEAEEEAEISGKSSGYTMLSENSEESTEKAGNDLTATSEEQSQKLDFEIHSAAQNESESLRETTYQTSLSNIIEEVMENKTEDILARDEDSEEKQEEAIIAQGEEESIAPSTEENCSSKTILTETQTSIEARENLEDDVPVKEVQSEVPAEENKDTEADTPGKLTDSNPSGQIDSYKNETMIKSTISSSLVKQLREETGAGMMDCKKALSETGGDIAKAQEYLRKKGLASADKKASRATAEGRIGSYIHDSRIGVLIEVNCETDFVARGDIFTELVEDLAMQVAASSQVQYLNPEDVPKEIVDNERGLEMQKEDLLLKPEQIRSKIVDGRIRKRLEDLALLEQPFIKDDKVVVKDWVKQTISTIGENIKVKRFVRYNLGEGLEKKSQDFAAEVAAQTAAKPVSASVKQDTVAAAASNDTTAESPKTVVSAALVKQLREETGAGMMDCKKALSETGGDLEKAQEYLRKKGLSTADKKSSRLAAEGRIGSYIHDSRIGVLIEVNCETDFVGRSQNFKELVDDLAMQVVASPQVQYVSIEDIPEIIVNEERQIEMQREDLQSKPDNIKEKIVEGRVTKRLGELSLLDQPFIKNDSLLVKDLIKQTVAALGENIKVRRFVRFTLGET